MRLSIRLLAALFVLAMVAPAAMADGDFTETSDRFFLRGTGCGATTNLFLDSRGGEDEYDGCGTIGGLPLNEALGSSQTLSTKNPTDIIVDANRDLEIIIRAESWVGDGAPGVGNSNVDVSLSGTETSGGFIPVQLGSGSSEILVVGADNATHTFTLDIPASAHGKQLKSLALTVSVRGVNINVNNLGMSGDSFITIPTLKPAQG